MPTNQEAFQVLVDLGRAVGEMGVSLSEAQARIDRSTLSIATEMAERAMPALLANPDWQKFSPEERERLARDAAERFARERTTFYAMPQVQIDLQSTLRVTRTQGGLIRMLLGGAGSNSQETTSTVRVTLAAVPASAEFGELLRSRNVELQAAALSYLEAQGAFRAAPPPDLGLTPAEFPQRVELSGTWSQPQWRRNLVAFKKVWNQRMRDAERETVALPVTDLPDRLTLSVLEDLADAGSVTVDAADLYTEARLLLAAFAREDDVHDPRRYSRTEWTASWGDYHETAMRTLLGREGLREPSAETVRALRLAWLEGKARLDP